VATTTQWQQQQWHNDGDGGSGSSGSKGGKGSISNMMYP
jgi:hypothetical protein